MVWNSIVPPSSVALCCFMPAEEIMHIIFLITTLNPPHMFLSGAGVKRGLCPWWWFGNSLKGFSFFISPHFGASVPVPFPSYLAKMTEMHPPSLAVLHLHLLERDTGLPPLETELILHATVVLYKFKTCNLRGWIEGKSQVAARWHWSPSQSKLRALQKKQDLFLLVISLVGPAV